MEIYNKAYLYIGFIVFSVGMYFDYLKDYHGIYLYILLSLGIILMLMAFKKPKKVKD